MSVDELNDPVDDDRQYPRDVMADEPELALDAELPEAEPGEAGDPTPDPDGAAELAYADAEVYAEVDADEDAYAEDSEPGYAEAQPVDATEPAEAMPAAEPGYGAAEPGYGAAEPGYGAAEPGYGAAEPGHGTTEPGDERTEPAVFVEPMPALESVGHPDVDAVVERLGELEQLPIDEHIEVYEDAHRQLHETLLAAGEDSGSG